MNDTPLFDVDTEPEWDRDAFCARIAHHSRLMEARAERDAALRAVDDNAEVRWKLEAERIVIDLAQTGRHFTSDDVMDRIERLPVTTHDTRALGPVILKALKREWIHRTGYVPSRRRHSTAIAEYVGII